MALSVGKLRGLQQLANDRGLLIMVAMDHRGSLEKMLSEGLGRPAGYEEMVDFKIELCRAAGPHCGAVLLDPIYGAAQAIVAGVLPGRTGLLVSLEESGYRGSKRARLTDLLPQWGVDRVKKMGASAAKLLLYYRPDVKEIAERQLETVRKVAADCQKADLPLLVEPVAYPINDREDNAAEFARIKPELVIETARHLSGIPMDVLKAEFPGDLAFEKDEVKLLDNCRRLDAASKHPWVILSGGHDYEVFRREVEIACKGGASGFLAGRALWQEVVKMPSRQARIDFFQTKLIERLKEITASADAHGRAWSARLEAGPPPGETWYASY